MALTTAGVALLGSVAGLARVGGIGFATLSDGLAALPASPSVYWAASFQEPTAPLLQLSPPAFLPAPVDDRRRGEVTVETSDRSSGERATGTGPPEATVTSQPLLVSESHSPVAQPNELTELASAPIAFANLIPMAAPVSELQPLWSPALRVSDGAVQLSRQMSRGSRAAALSSGQFFARLGRSFAGASSQAERLASRGDDQQP